MDHHKYEQGRDVSSSEDHCKCEACRKQDQTKNPPRQNPTNIHMFKHLKKRGGPPVKKQLPNKNSSHKGKDPGHKGKEASHKGKYMTRRQELQKKTQPQKVPALPNKHRLTQALRSKQSPTASFFMDYHPVSHSQRQKLASRDGASNYTEQPRRIMNLQNTNQRLEEIAHTQNKLHEIELCKPGYLEVELGQRDPRSLSQASAGCDQQHQDRQSTKTKTDKMTK